VLKLIEDFNVELLPTTPSFLNVILFSEKYKQYDLSSLKIISYGTEVMHKNTLKKLNTIFPNIRLLQTYGLSELGVMRSQSENNSSLWVKIGGEQFKTRVVNDKLEIKSESAMLGYLNAKSPFTDDGWFKTNDLVETKGEFFKILGRQSEIINVGGQKVYPSEIENLLLEMEDVEDISIYGESNVLMGQVVCAKVKINHKNKKLFRKKMRVYCKGKIEKYKIPTKIYFTDDKIYNNRFKRIRR
jgi:acyl-CoA synthetase (AMP-forming)/AMP-acid ligase II